MKSVSLANQSSLIFESIASNQYSKFCSINSRISKIQGIFNDSQQLHSAWIALGMYISSQLRAGKGVSIPKLGTFTFTAPSVDLRGVTNPEQRNKLIRIPVFLIAKNFVLGKEIKSAIFYNKRESLGVRPYNGFSINGQIPIAKINLAEISIKANMSKDSVQLALTRIFKYLSDTVKNKDTCTIEIPHVGFLFFKNGKASVKFVDGLERKHRANVSNLTSSNLQKLQLENQYNKKTLNFLKIQQKTKEFLKKEFQITLNQNKARKSVTFKPTRLNSESTNKQVGLVQEMQNNFFEDLNKQVIALKVGQQQLQNELNKYDQKHTGFINQSDLKKCLEHFGININLSQLIQLVKLVTLDAQDRIKYSQLIRKIYHHKQSKLKKEFRLKFIQDIRSWFIKQKRKTILEAFEYLDQDSDSAINLNQLTNFITKELNYRSNQVTEKMIQNLLHHYGDGNKINFIMFNKLINQENKPNKDWIINLKKTIAEFIIRTYENHKKAFVQISDSNDRIRLDSFKNWLLSKKILSPIQANQIYDLFHDIEKHNREYLFEKQFIEFLRPYQRKNELVRAMLQILQTRFLTSRQAFDYMTDLKQLDYIQWVKKIKQLLNNRFSKQQITKSWYQFAGENQLLTFNMWNNKTKVWKFIPKSNEKVINNQQNLILLINKNRKMIEQMLLKQSNEQNLVQKSIACRIIQDIINKDAFEHFQQKTYDKIMKDYTRNQRVDLKPFLQNMRIKSKQIQDFP